MFRKSQKVEQKDKEERKGVLKISLNMWYLNKKKLQKDTTEEMTVMRENRGK